MTDTELRNRCLELAVSLGMQNTLVTLEAAQEFSNWIVTGKSRLLPELETAGKIVWIKDGSTNIQP